MTDRDRFPPRKIQTIVDLFDDAEDEAPELYDSTYRVTRGYREKTHPPLGDLVTPLDEGAMRVQSDDVVEDEEVIEEEPKLRMDINDADIINMMTLPTYSEVPLDEMAFVTNHQSIMELEGLLEGQRNAHPPRHFITIFMLRDLRHKGLISQHISNEILTTVSSKQQFVIVSCIVQRLSREEDPELCLTLYLVVRPVEDKQLEMAYTSRQSVDLENSSIESAAVGAATNLTTKHKEAMERDRNDPTSELGKFKLYREEMLKQLILPAVFCNYYFRIERILDYQEKYSLSI